MVAALTRTIDTPLLLIGLVLMVVTLASLAGSEQLSFTLTEMLIRMVVVIGIAVFVGNAGIVSFGHIGFMCIGAYAAAWATIDPAWKQVMLSGLPEFLQNRQYPFPAVVLGAGLLAAAVALALGAALMRLNGLAASIATFAFLAIVNSVYSNWDSVTGGTSSVIGIPTVVGPWIAYLFVAPAIVCAFVFQNSGTGLMLRASRDDEVAARASGVNVVRVRLLAFVWSGFLVGTGGALQAHFLGVLTTDGFYLPLSFITLAMLVIGGIATLSGAVVGTLAVTLVLESLRAGERGLTFGTIHLALPAGTAPIGLGLVMALILVFRPGGLCATEIRWANLVRGRRLRLGSMRANPIQ